MTLEIQHVRMSFGPVQAVRDVWLDVPEGSVVGVIGPNGAGKTTTMRMILQIITPQAGTITWAGKPVGQWPLGTFGYLPEERGLYPQMRGHDELRFFARLHGLSSGQVGREIAYWSNRLELGEVLSKKVEELSKGNAQKLQFLAAVLHRPQLVILDEPFSGLDPVNARLFKDAIKHLHELGATILFSSHQMDNVEELCDRVCLIADGRTVIHGSIDQVRRESGTRVLTIRLSEEPGSGEAAAVCPDVGDLLAGHAGLQLLESGSGYWRYELLPGTDSDAILYNLAGRCHIQQFSVDYPGLEDIYIARVSRQGHVGEPAPVPTQEVAVQ